MVKFKDVISQIQKHKRFLLFAIFICAIGSAIVYSERHGINWNRQAAALHGWLFFDPTAKRSSSAAPASSSDIKPSFSREPTFDAAFADADGKLVAAGRGSPGWTIRLSSNGALLGETKASPRGEWVFEPNEPLAPGNYALSLLAIEPQGQHTIPGMKAIELRVAPRLTPPPPARARAVAGVPEIK